MYTNLTRLPNLLPSTELKQLDPSVCWLCKPPEPAGNLEMARMQRPSAGSWDDNRDGLASFGFVGLGFRGSGGGGGRAGVRGIYGGLKI